MRQLQVDVECQLYLDSNVNKDKNTEDTQAHVTMDRNSAGSEHGFVLEIVQVRISSCYDRDPRIFPSIDRKGPNLRNREGQRP